LTNKISFFQVFHYQQNLIKNFPFPEFTTTGEPQSRNRTISPLFLVLQCTRHEKLWPLQAFLSLPRFCCVRFWLSSGRKINKTGKACAFHMKITSESTRNFLLLFPDLQNRFFLLRKSGENSQKIWYLDNQG
jgi:hypothetical protein